MDAEVFYNADPEGFYGYFQGGELIAGGAVISYDGLFGFMGLFIVHPSYRSRGVGRALWQERRDLLLTRLKPGAAIGMDGVVAMQPFYARGGFRMAFRSERHQRTGELFPPNPNIHHIFPNDFDTVLNYDTKCFGFPRSLFLFPWLLLPGGFGFMYKHHGEVMGFASMRKAIHGYKIGPLFAESAIIAEALYRACLSAAPGEDIFIDIPMVNTAAVRMAQNYNTLYVFECGRMYLGNFPVISGDRIFGITTFELG